MQLGLKAFVVAIYQLGVIDGVLTEDSDVFLFGARSVYRNIFDDKKFVEVRSAGGGMEGLTCAFLGPLHFIDT